MNTKAANGTETTRSPTSEKPDTINKGQTLKTQVTSMLNSLRFVPNAHPLSPVKNPGRTNIMNKTIKSGIDRIRVCPVVESKK